MKLLLPLATWWIASLPMPGATITSVNRSVSAYSPGYTYLNGSNLVTVLEDSRSATSNAAGSWDQTVSSQADYVGTGTASQRAQIQAGRFDIFNMAVRSSGFADLPDLFHAQSFANATGASILSVSFDLSEPSLYEFNGQFSSSAVGGINYTGSLTGLTGGFSFSQPMTLPPGGIYDPLYYQGVLPPGSYTFSLALTAAQNYYSFRQPDWADVSGASLTFSAVPEPQTGLLLALLGFGLSRRFQCRPACGSEIV
jgi:hypothetical protein